VGRGRFLQLHRAGEAMLRHGLAQQDHEAVFEPRFDWGDGCPA